MYNQVIQVWKPPGIYGYGYMTNGTTGRFLTATSKNSLHFDIRFDRNYEEKAEPMPFHVLFLATKQQLRAKLRVTARSSVSGYIMPAGYPYTAIPTFTKASHTIHAPNHYSVMVSFVPRMDLHRFHMGHGSATITLSRIQSNGTGLTRWTKRGVQNIPVQLHDSSIHIKIIASFNCASFKIYFSLHPPQALPLKLHSGLFNCSVPHYASFEEHVRCNLKKECEGREDEGGHCPFSSAACDGNIAVANVKCYSLHVLRTRVSWLQAKGLCEAKSGQLAIMRSMEEMRVFLEMLDIAKTVRNTHIGLLIDDTVTNLYRHTWRWVDKTIAYFIPNIKMVYQKQMVCHTYISMGFMFHCPNIPGWTFSYACEHVLVRQSFSRLTSRKHSQTRIKIANSQNWTRGQLERKARQPLTVCPGGHWTHDFLKCDLQTACLVKHYEMDCPLGDVAGEGQGRRSEKVTMFVCDNLFHIVPYTLVCNFAPDCSDGSDETFCLYTRNACGASQHHCDSGQCISLSVSRPAVMCDIVSDCYDGSDEASCPHIFSQFERQTVNSPSRIDFEQGYKMTIAELKNPYTCPSTHFMCPENFDDCIPVYVRCNGYYDCPQGEDEMDCGSYTCPGFYRCRGARACVHLTQLCDSVAQCEGRDDEMLCEFFCPSSCQCQGLAFVCPQLFPVSSFPQLRYLDAGHSLMNLGDFVNNSYLIWLSLHSCGLKVLSSVSLDNLQTLDLSHNKLLSVNADFLQYLPNLEQLKLSDNPIAMITAADSTTKPIFLQKIDLSKTHLAEFDCSLFPGFHAVRHFNVSHCGTLRLSKEMFSCFKYMHELDVRGTALIHSKLSLTGELQQIETIFSDNYRHCCPTVLPDVQHNVFCLAPQSGVSSCSDLLRLPFHRAYLWFMALVSCLGNACYLLVKKMYYKNTENISAEVFAFNLIAANLIMGVYVCLVLVADLQFRGSFLQHEKTWVESTACKVAGFLALLSNEVACLTVLLLSVDRFVALYFSSRRFTVKSAWLSCFFSMLLAAALYSPFPVSSWKMSSRTNLCIPVPRSNNEARSVIYLFNVVIAVNVTFALITCISQSMVHHYVRSNYVTATNSQMSQDMVLARRVMTLVVADVIWRFGVAVMCLLVCVTTTDMFETIFALSLPLKTALNPLVYANGLLAERRRKRKESRLVMLVKQKSQPKAAQPPPAKSDPDTLLPSVTNLQDVLRHLKRCLRSGSLNVTDVHDVLEQYDQTH